MIDISIKELIQLKEQGLSDKAISEYMETQGIKIAPSTVSLKLREYYKSKGEKRKRVKYTSKDRIKIDTLEIVELKRKGMTDKKIVEHYEKQGIKISAGGVNLRLRKYYKTHKEEKNMVNKLYEQNSQRIHIENSELATLKEQGLSDKQISEYYAKQGINIAISTVSARLSIYYRTRDRKMADVLLKDILMSGESIKEATDNDENKIRIVLNRLKRLRFVVENAKKVGDKWVPDNDFLEVIKRIECIDNNNSYNRFDPYIRTYINKGLCENGKIDLIRDKVFNRNADLMVYVLLGKDLKYGEQYDKKIWETHKKNYEEKIEKYFTRLYIMEERQDKEKLKRQAEKTDNKIEER